MINNVMIFLVLILGILPGFAWLVFYVKEEETHRESKRLILFAFVAGMAFGLIAVILENLLNTAAAGIGIAELSLVGTHRIRADRGSRKIRRGISHDRQKSRSCRIRWIS